MLHAEKHTIEINRLLSLPVFKRHIDNAAANPDTRIVNQHIEP